MKAGSESPWTFNVEERVGRVTGASRSVLYRGSLSEMVVPYGDAAPQQARENAFDAGEYVQWRFL